MSEIVVGSPLVVIGASAGGVEALLRLVGTLRASIVIAPHLDPTRPSHLDEIRARAAPPSVVTVIDHAVLQAGTVYVVPANCQVQITDHDLTVFPEGTGWLQSADLESANTHLARQHAELQQRNAALAAAQQQAEAAAAQHTRQMEHLVATNRALLAVNEELARANTILRATSATTQLSAAQGHDATEEAARIKEALRAATKALETLNEQRQATLDELNASNADRTARGDDLLRLTATKEALQHRLLQGVIQAQENERRRVARELHDDIGQSLTALVLAVGVIQAALPESATREQQILEDATGLAENMMDGLRRVIADLRPPVLDDLGLVPALRRLGNDLQERAGVVVTVQADDVAGRLPPAVEITLFRVAQEALANIGKHAHAQQAGILLRREPGHVTLRITDNGQGLPAHDLTGSAAADRDNAYHDGAHFGLLGMQERVALLNGVLRVEGAPHRGTIVSVELPLDGT